MFGLALYAEWREEEMVKKLLYQHLEDPEMEKLCARVLEWPWDAIVIENG